MLRHFAVRISASVIVFRTLSYGARQSVIQAVSTLVVIKTYEIYVSLWLRMEMGRLGRTCYHYVEFSYELSTWEAEDWRIADWSIGD